MDKAYEQAALKLLENDIEDVIKELSQNPAMKEFRKNYEKMYNALRNSHDREQELTGNCEHLCH